MLDKLIKLIEVKKIIALLLTTVFCILSIKGIVDKEQFIVIFTMIITYYFTQSVEKERKK